MWNPLWMIRHFLCSQLPVFPTITNTAPAKNKQTMASSRFSESQIQEIKDAFFLFDKDNSGKLAVGNLRSYMFSFTPYLADYKLTGNVALLDADKNSDVDVEDFLTVVADIQADSSQGALHMVWTMLVFAAAKDSEIALRAFRKYNKNGDGVITSEELRDFMAPATKALGEDPSVCQLQDAIEAVDVDGNRKVDFEEFKSLLAILEQRN